MCARRALQRLRPSAVFALPAAAASILAGFAAPAAATMLPVEGGPGGSYFQAQCPSGQYLVGFSVKAGAWIDGIAVLCSTYVPAQHKFGSRTRGTPHGGSGGAPQEAYCPTDSYVRGLGYTYTRDGDKRQYVDDIGMSCVQVVQVGATTVADRVCIGSNDAGTTGSGVDDPNSYSDCHYSLYEEIGWSAEDCPEGEAAIGIHGRSGDFLDALGLMCGPEASAGVKRMGKARTPATVHQTPVAKALQARPASTLTQNATRNPAQNSGRFASSPTRTAAQWATAPAAGPSKAPRAPAPSGPPPTYALTCVGGGGMTAKATPDGFVRVSFTPAAQGSAVAAPRPGQCAWSDRGFRAGEPQMLVYRGRGNIGQHLVKAAHRRARFQVHAYNNEQGAMIVTAIDEDPATKD